MFETFAPLWHVHLEGGNVLRTTPEHPIYVLDKGWIPACGLHPGDLLRTNENEWKAVEEAYDTGTGEKVYNCRVEDYHTYFVGQQAWGYGIWAHNACSSTSGNNAASVALAASPDGQPCTFPDPERGQPGPAVPAGATRGHGQKYFPFGLTADQFVLLTALAREDGVTQKELARLTHSDPNTISEMLGRLERRGLIRRERHADDARALNVSLTAGGWAAQRRAMEAVAPFCEALADLVPADEWEAMLGHLNRIAGGMSATESLPTRRAGAR